MIGHIHPHGHKAPECCTGSEERAAVKLDQPAHRPTTDSQSDRPINTNSARQPYPRPAGRSPCNPKARRHRHMHNARQKEAKRERAENEEAIIMAHDACRRRKRNRSACIRPAISIMSPGMFLRPVALCLLARRPAPPPACFCRC